MPEINLGINEDTVWGLPNDPLSTVGAFAWTQASLPVPADGPERVACAFDRVCMRRNAEGLVPRLDENGEFQTEVCVECGLIFCLRHQHTRQRNAMCSYHQAWHPRCITTTRCETCAHFYCEEADHNTAECDPEDDPEEDYDEDNGGMTYHGDFRQAELSFEGDTPVAGLAEGLRYAAIELECENGDNVEIPPRFGITTDGSLNESGIEITTPPARMNVLVHDITEITNLLSGNGWKAGSRTGMHVHIDMRDRKNDPVFLSRLFSAFYAVEDILFAMQSNERHYNQYCRPLRDQWQFFATYGQSAPDFDFTYYKQPKTLQNKRYMDRQKAEHSGPRYNAFNFHSIYFRGSLEVRLHEGCLDGRKALMWIELLQKIIARVEDGLPYPLMVKLVNMNVTEQKLRLFKRIFHLDKAMMAYVVGRIESASRMGMHLSFTFGTPKRGRTKSLYPRRAFRATHRRCRWCGHVMSMTGACRYCNREPVLAPNADAWGDSDDVGMYLSMEGTQREFVTATEYPTRP